MKTYFYQPNNRLLSPFLLLIFCFFAVSSEVLAQDCGGEVDANEKAMNYSLYYESFKNKDYQTALPYLKWVLRCAPGFAGPNKNDDRNFDRAVKLYQGLADGTEDATMKRSYLDTALVYFDEAPVTLTDAGADFSEHEWLRNKGRFIQHNAEVLDDMQSEAAGLYHQVFNGDPTLLEPLGFYVNTVVATYARDDMKNEAVTFMDDVEAQFGSDQEVADVLASWRERLFDSPEERMSFLEDQLEKSPEDTAIIEELLDIYTELEERDKLSAMLTRMIDVAPSPKVHITDGIMKLNDGDPRAAMDAFKSALDMPGGSEYAKEANYNMGNAARELGNLSQARTYYRRALQADRSFGQALLEIANVYAEAVRDCGGSKMEREDRAVYWLVADYLERARATDSSVGSRASQMIQQYRPYFPAAEDLFFKGWKEGDSYAIDYGCYSWVGETTKVRKP